MSIFDKLKRGAADAVKNAAQNAVSSFTEKRETFTFTALPESLAEMQDMQAALELLGVTPTEDTVGGE